MTVRLTKMSSWKILDIFWSCNHSYSIKIPCDTFLYICKSVLLKVSRQTPKSNLFCKYMLFILRLVLYVAAISFLRITSRFTNRSVVKDCGMDSVICQVCDLSRVVLYVSLKQEFLTWKCRVTNLQIRKCDKYVFHCRFVIEIGHFCDG